MTDSNHLHLPSLSIKGFRGIDSLSIPRLGRVTLLAGKNGVGKTTVLDAVRVYASRGRASVISNVLLEHEEATLSVDEDAGARFHPDWRALFYGRNIYSDSYISIGPASAPEQLSIRQTVLDEEYSEFLRRILPDFQIFRILRVVYEDYEQILPLSIYLDDPLAELVPKTVRRNVLPSDMRQLINQDDPPVAIECESLGPGLVDKGLLLRFWDSVALTDSEERAVNALRLVSGPDVERVAVIGDNNVAAQLGQSGRRALVRLKGHKQPVPLKSLGDGALRLFGVAMALASSRDGFLLIDEAENGIHYSLQRDYWRMVLRTAQENNVQVVATTHSWDCVKGFAQAAMQSEDADAALVRLSRQYGDLRAVEYLKQDLATAAEQGIEVR